MLHPIRDVPRRRSGLRAQSYTAYVVKNDDTEKQERKNGEQPRQRVQLRSSVLHRNVSDEHIPWAMPEQQGQANAGKGVGSVDVPPVGAKVFIRYDEDDPHNVYYSTSPTTDDVAKDHEGNKEDYPHNKVSVDQSGNKTSTNHKKGTKAYTHKPGQAQQYDSEGNLYLYAPKNLNLGAGGDINIAAKGKINVHAGGELSLKGSKIQLNGSDKKVEPTAVGAREKPQIESPAGKTGL